MTARWLIPVALVLGCSNASRQPWRAALDEGKVIKLGGEIGKLTPPPVVPTPSPVAVPPTVVPERSSPPAIKPALNDDPFPVPPPPKGINPKSPPVIPSKDDKSK